MIAPGGLKAVFLDMDDTLSDTESLATTRLAGVRDLLEGEVRAGRLDEVIDQAAAWDPLADEETGRIGRLQKMTDALALSEEQTARMRARYNEVLVELLTLQEGVAETLMWLRSRVKLGLITNGPSEFQRRKIAKLGIADSFDSITISGEVGVHKPDPALFRAALQSVDAAAGATLYAGDRPKFDMEGSSAAGMTSVLIRKDYAYPLPAPAAADFVVGAVTELPRLIEENAWLSALAPDPGARQEAP